MSLNTMQKKEIENLLTTKIRKKLLTYNPETNHMPFHTRLFGKDRMALFLFIQSINLILEVSVFQEVAIILARPHFKAVEAQYKELNSYISSEAQAEVQMIINELTTGRIKPDKNAEIERLRAVAISGSLIKIKKPRIDIYLLAHDGVEYYFDLITAKPNMHELKAHKRKLLEWAAYRLQANPTARLKTSLVIPYNPYEPEPYERWRLAGLYDLPEELLVAEEFWDLLGGKGAYDDLLEVFKQVGVALRPEIDQRFAKFK